MSSTTLKLLVVDDSDVDAELTVRELSRAGFAITWRRVDTGASMAAALREEPWDLVLSDFRMPQFSGLEALSLARDADRDLPFILVSGAVGQDLAVEIMRAGAHDYVAKDRLFRLGPAVERELRDARTRRAHRRAELELRKMAMVVEQIPSVVVITDLEGNIEYVNPRFTELTGYTRDEVQGKNPRLLKSGGTPPQEYRRLWETVAAGNEWRGSFQQRRKDGSVYDEEAVIRPMRDEHGRTTHYFKVGEDVTARHALEQQFRQAQKMEAVGRLAGGVAHDFNNLLTVISGFTEMAMLGLEPDDPLLGDLQQVAMAGERGAALTRQLLAFSRKQALEPAPFVLSRVVREAESMVTRLVGEDVAITLRTDEADAGSILAEPGQIEQVLMNLVVNARDAMPTGGRLTITTGIRAVAAGAVAPHAQLKPGLYAALTVGDTGHGMSSDTMSKIFEPFFTTKDVGKGSGLGLSTVYGIVSQLGGAIDVTSEPDAGSSFTVLLPISIAPATGAAGAASGAPDTAGSETILVVDDEVPVARLAQRILAAAGYTVMTASHAGEALVVCEKYSVEIHLLLTDVIMPQMSGRELADRLTEGHPQLRVLFMSGYTDDALDDKDALGTGRPLLRKPFSGELLLRKVREILDQSPVTAATGAGPLGE
ncbi:MAG TPA: response regulator [Vicinamibacterales bacterium]|nr:response regulator [Vicinamibacterales bacterium]